MFRFLRGSSSNLLSNFQQNYPQFLVKTQQGDGFILDIRAPHVVIEGLKFHVAPDIAVQVNADDVTIRDYYFDGCIRGIESLGSANLTVEYCEYSGYPTYQWVRWGQLRGVNGKMGLWNTIYASNLCNTFIHHFGPSVKVRHSMVYVSPERGLKHCTLLRFDCPWRRDFGAPSRGITFVHNTLVNSYHTLSWTKHTFVDCVFENNVMMVNRSSRWEQEGLVPTRYNLFTGPNVNPSHMPPMLTGIDAGFEQAPDFAASALPVLPLQEAGLAEPSSAFDGPHVDFRLCADSPAVDAGAPDTTGRYHHKANGPASDLGAIELGDDWEFPRPGPRWAIGEKRPLASRASSVASSPLGRFDRNARKMTPCLPPRYGTKQTVARGSC